MSQQAVSMTLLQRNELSQEDLCRSLVVTDFVSLAAVATDGLFFLLDVVLPCVCTSCRPPIETKYAWTISGTDSLVSVSKETE